jgi:hypothetical protein
MSDRVTFIDDGFGDPIGSIRNTVDKPAGRDPEPERATASDSGPSGIPTIDPADIRNFDGEPPKRRGRPRGSKNRQYGGSTETEAKSTFHLELDIKSLLISGHLMLASMTAPEMMLDITEAEHMETDLKRLAQFYPIGMDPKKFAWCQLSMTLGSVYVTRLIAIYKRMQTEAEKKGPVPVTPIDRDKQAAKPAPSSAPPKQVSLAGLNPSQLYNEPPVPDM